MANLMLSKEDEKQVLESCNFATSGMSYLDEDILSLNISLKKMTICFHMQMKI